MSRTKRAREWFVIFAATVSVACGGGGGNPGDSGTDGGTLDGAMTMPDAGDAGLAPECTEDMCGVCDADPTNDCTQDCAGDWGGSATADDCGTCDTDPTNDCVTDCAGTPGGSATPDMCGVCDTDPTNDCAEDCAGTWGGSAVVDDCGTCDADASNDCDCAGTPGGSATVDMCAVCDADASNDCTQDCNGDWGGTATLDGCGTCDTDPTNDCPNDCNGVPGGPARLDMCGTCDTDTTNDCVQDCAGAWGGTATTDMCGTCDTDATNDCVQDCAGAWGGTATTDMCGTCDTNAANDCVQDCHGDWGGAAVLDLCGRCTGGASGATACPTITLNPVADSWVDEGAPSTNRGTSNTLEIRATDRPNGSHVFLRFDLSSIPDDVEVRGVRLQAQAFQGFAWGGNGNVYTQFVADDTWSETAINWTNQPTTDDVNLGFWWLWYNRTAVDRLGVNQNVALVPVVRREREGDGLVSFRLHSAGYDTSYRSREYANEAQRPALVVGYLPATTVTLEPVADAYVDSSSTNFGTAPHLYIDRALHKFFLRFDLSSLPAGAEVVQSTLTMTAYEGWAYGGNGNVYTRFVSNDAWGETTVNGPNAPTAETDPLGFWWLWYNHVASDQTGSVSTDALRDSVQTETEGDDTISFELSSPGYRTHYRSREYANAAQRPNLVIRYVMP